jgi:hypothetical protein
MSIHRTGSDIEDVLLTRQPVELDDTLRSDLTDVLLKNFLLEAPYTFSDPDSSSKSNIQILISNMTKVNDRFHEYSTELTSAYAGSFKDKKMKPGELIFCGFEKVIYNGRQTRALVIIKTDSKEDFLELDPAKESYMVSIRKGLSMNRQNRIVLIVGTGTDNEVQLFFKKTDLGMTQNHFMDGFLMVTPEKSDFYYTSNHLKMIKTYMQDEMEEDDKIEKIDKLNRSVEFMRNNDRLDIKQFESDIFDKPEHIEAFENFRKNYARDHELEIVDEFDISEPAIRKNQRYIRSVIKLDKNFHIYVHGNRHNIVKGYDPERKMNYYTLYFTDES